MITANDLWLRGQTAQRQFMQIANYNSAFLSTAMVQVAHMSMTAPRAFWSAMARAGGAATLTEGKPVAKAAKLAPKPAGKPAPKPAVVADAAPAKPKAAKTSKAPKAPKAPAKPKLAAMTALEKVADRPSEAPAPKPDAASPAKAKAPAAPKPAAKAAAKPEAAPAPAPAAKPAVKAAASAAPKAPAKAATAPKPVAASPAKPDDLTALLGVGAKLATALNAQGITTYRDLATLDDAGIERVEASAKGFRMLCARYDVVGQAKAMG